MVEIREETDAADQASGGGTSSPQSAGDSTSRQPSANNTQAGSQMSLINFIKNDPIYTVCAWLRILTLFFMITYFLNALGLIAFATSYSKAFAAAAATNAFRLHQRLRASSYPVFSREFVSLLLLEDSAHYLLYCVAFISSPPVTMALFPIVLYALLHTASYVIKMHEVTRRVPNVIIGEAFRFRDQYTQVCLSTIACVEIVVFPVFVGMIMMGKANFLFVFLYYRFLSLRYASRRNPHTRMAFYNFKMSLFSFTDKPACPGFIKQLVYKATSLIERLAPPIQAQ